jgi:hypothetical protein
MKINCLALLKNKMYNLLVFILFSFLISGCGSSIKKPDNSTAILCAKNFIQSIYKGKFDEAATIITKDDESKDCLNKRKFTYQQTFDKQQKLAYNKSAVIFENTIQETENITLFEIIDPISRKKIPTLKVIKQGNEWLVNFAYSCSGNL